MSELDRIYEALRPSLRDVTGVEFRTYLQGLEPALELRPQRRTQLTLRRLRFRGDKNGDFRFQPGVNVLRAGNDKGKSSILKLVHFCLTGKNELKKDVDAWISEVDLTFELDGVPHAIAVDKRKRPKGRLVRSVSPPEAADRDLEAAFDPLHGAQDAVAVPDGRHPMLEVELESLEDQRLVVRPVGGVLFDAPGPPEGERHVDVGVDEPGRGELAVPVDDLGALRDGHRRPRTHGGNPVPLDDDRPVNDGNTPVSVDDRRPDDRKRW